MAVAVLSLGNYTLEALSRSALKPELIANPLLGFGREPQTLEPPKIKSPQNPQRPPPPPRKKKKKKKKT